MTTQETEPRFRPRLLSRVFIFHAGPSFRCCHAVVRASLPDSNDRTFSPISITSLCTKAYDRQYASMISSLISRCSAPQGRSPIVRLEGGKSPLLRTPRFRSRFPSASRLTRVMCAQAPGAVCRSRCPRIPVMLIELDGHRRVVEPARENRVPAATGQGEIGFHFHEDRRHSPTGSVGGT